MSCRANVKFSNLADIVDHLKKAEYPELTWVSKNYSLGDLLNDLASIEEHQRAGLRLAERVDSLENQVSTLTECVDINARRANDRLGR